MLCSFKKIQVDTGCVNPICNTINDNVGPYIKKASFQAKSIKCSTVLYTKRIANKNIILFIGSKASLTISVTMKEEIIMVLGELSKIYQQRMENTRVKTIVRDEQATIANGCEHLQVKAMLNHTVHQTHRQQEC